MPLTYTLVFVERTENKIYIVTFHVDDKVYAWYVDKSNFKKTNPKISRLGGGGRSWIRLWPESVIWLYLNYLITGVYRYRLYNILTIQHPFPIYFWLFWFHGFIQCYFISQIIIQSALYLLSFFFFWQENIDLQLENNYRDRLKQTYSEVKSRLVSSKYIKTCLIRHLSNLFLCLIQHWFSYLLDNFLCVVHCVIQHTVYSDTKCISQCLSD